MRNLSHVQNILGVSGPDHVAQLLEPWTSIEMSQVQIILGQEKFLANPNRFIPRVISLYRNIILLSKENQDMRYIIFES